VEKFYERKHECLYYNLIYSETVLLKLITVNVKSEPWDILFSTFT